MTMARIRTIKPEFWTSEQVVDCSLTARLLFIGIWNFCDDHGVHPASAKRVKMEVFPSDPIGDAAIHEMIDELTAAGLLYAYEVDGKGYWQVTGWAKHQKIEKPTYRHPLPRDEAQVASSTLPRRSVGEGSVTARPRNGMESNGDKSLSGMSDAIAILNYLNEKTGRSYRPVKAHISMISARLRESTIEECRAVIDTKAAAWQHDPTMREYLRPATLFNATKFANYVGELGNSGRSGRDWERRCHSHRMLVRSYRPV
jgi:uncharacterized phage protein (TIGR02220 family)